MMKTNSQKRILPLALSGGILICLICIYSGRSVLLRSIVNRHTSRIEQTHGLCIHYDKLEMNGLNEISLQGLSVIPEQRDTLFTLASTRIKLNFWKLLTKKIEVSYIAAEDIRLTFTKQDSIANYDFSLKRPESSITNIRSNRNGNQLCGKNKQTTQFMLRFST